MTSRTRWKLAIMLALFVLFAALPVQASSPSEFKFEGVTGNNHWKGAGKWEFSWKTLDDEDYGIIQFKDITSTSGGGQHITTVFTSISITDSWESGYYSHITFSPLISNPSGKTLQFRLRVVTRHCQSDSIYWSTEVGGYACAHGWEYRTTDWAYLDVTFS